MVTSNPARRQISTGVTNSISSTPSGRNASTVVGMVVSSCHAALLAAKTNLNRKASLEVTDQGIAPLRARKPTYAATRAEHSPLALHLQRVA